MYRRLLAPLFLSALLSTAALAQFPTNSQPGVKLRGRNFSDLYAGQKVLLSNYCRLDFEGARLQPEGWNRLKPFTSMRANPDFSRIIIVTRFDIEPPDHPTEDLYVSYQVVGYYQQGDGFSAVSANDRVEFHVQEQNGNLLVTGLAPETPHVAPRAAIAWINQRLADPSTTDWERAHLKDAAEQLQKLYPQPHPATAP